MRVSSAAAWMAVVEIPQQGLDVALAARLLDRALQRIAGQLLDQLALRLHQERGARRDARRAGAQQREEQPQTPAAAR